MVDVHQTFQFENVRQAPVARSGAVREPTGAIGKGLGPGEGIVPLNNHLLKQVGFEIAD